MKKLNRDFPASMKDIPLENPEDRTDQYRLLP